MKRGQSLVYPIYFNDQIILWGFGASNRSTCIYTGRSTLCPSKDLIYRFNNEVEWIGFVYAQAIKEKMKDDHHRA